MYKTDNIKEGDTIYSLDRDNVNEPLFPVYQKGTPVEWQGQGTNFYIMEDNGDYNALISTSMNIEDPTYNDWWIDKTFLRLIIKENL